MIHSTAPRIWPCDLPRDSIHHDTPSAFPYIVPRCGFWWDLKRMVVGVVEHPMHYGLVKDVARQGVRMVT